MPKIFVKELFANPADTDEMSSDSDNDIATWVDAPAVAETARRDPKLKAKLKEELDTTINTINNKLLAGQPVDLAAFPPLFVVNYRGIEFFELFYTQEARRQARRQIREGQTDTFYASSAYQLAGLRMGEPLDTPEKIERIKRAKKQVIADMESLNRPERTHGWWGAAPAFDSPLYAHYQRYVNSYESFRRESEGRAHSVFQSLHFSATPYISTSDQAIHAVHYATGAKASAIHRPLRPSYYDDNGLAPLRAKHPVTGYVEVIFHELHEIARKKPLRLTMLHAAAKISIDTRILHEMETTFIARIGKHHIVHREPVRYPSFHREYIPGYHKERYGIASKASYSRYRRLFARPPQKDDARTILPDVIAEHYAGKLEKIAKELAGRRRGYIVYITPEGLLSRKPVRYEDISNYRNACGARAIDLTAYYNGRIGLFNKSHEMSPGAAASSVPEPEPVAASSLGQGPG